LRYQVCIISLIRHIKEGNKFISIVTTTYYIAKVYTSNSIIVAIEDVIDYTGT